VAPASLGRVGARPRTAQNTVMNTGNESNRHDADTRATFCPARGKRASRGVNHNRTSVAIQTAITGTAAGPDGSKQRCFHLRADIGANAANGCYEHDGSDTAA